MTLRELVWMEAGRDEAAWDTTKWILAKLDQCRTEEAKKIKLLPESWNIPELRKREIARMAAERKRELDEIEAMKNPDRIEEIRRERMAAFQAFTAQLIGNRR